MANILYPLFKQTLLTPGFDLVTGLTLKGMLLNIRNTDPAGTFYTQSNAHQFLTDIPAGCRATAGVALTTKTAIQGIFDADDTNFPSVSFTYPVGACIIYNDTGTPSTSPLVAYIDTVVGLPLTTTGVDVQIVWDNGANKIFAL